MKFMIFSIKLNYLETKQEWVTSHSCHQILHHVVSYEKNSHRTLKSLFLKYLYFQAFGLFFIALPILIIKCIDFSCHRFSHNFGFFHS